MAKRQGMARGCDMAAFEGFLSQLLDHGKVVFGSAKPPQDRPTARDVATLADAFATFAISVAGPPIPFDPPTACEAAEAGPPGELGARQPRGTRVRPEAPPPDGHQADGSRAAPLGRSPAALRAPDPQAGPRPRSDRPPHRDPRRPPPAMAALGRPVRCRGRSADPARLRRATRASCSSTPNASRPTIARPGVPNDQASRMITMSSSSKGARHDRHPKPVQVGQAFQPDSDPDRSGTADGRSQAGKPDHFRPPPPGDRPPPDSIQEFFRIKDFLRN